jgi:3-hydroxyisobutyrate dehydrogenase
VCECVAYAVKSGLDPKKVIASLAGGGAASWTLNNLAPRIIDGNFKPGFFIKHFIKDLKIALDSAEEMNLDMHGTKLAKKLYEQLASQGEENSGTQALYKLYI